MTHDHFRSVSCRDNRDTEGFLHAVHFIQKSRKHAFIWATIR
jgi:hypothetical protein